MLRLGSGAPIVVEFVGGRLFRMPFHPVGIPEYKGDADNGQHNPAEEPVFKAREDGQPRNTLGYANGEGVQHGTGKAHMGSHIAHADAYN